MSLWISLFGSVKILAALPFCYRCLLQTLKRQCEMCMNNRELLTECQCARVASIDHSLLT